VKLFRKMADWVRSVSLTDGKGWRDRGGLSDSGEYVSTDSALALSAVWACVNLISGTVSSLPVRVYRTRDGQREIARDHPLAQLLDESPNFDQTSVDFWDFICAALELKGNAYARIERFGARIVSLWPVNPDAVTVRRLESGTLEYRWSADGRTYVETDATMLHIRGFGGNPLGGLSTLQFARQSFGMAQAANRAAASLFANGMRPSGTLTFADWLPPAKRDEVKQRVREEFMGAANAGRPFVLEGGTKWDSLTINPEDAQMLESRGFSIEEVCRFFQVPPFMVGHTEKTTSWGKGLTEQVLGFQKFNLRRRVKRIEKACGKQLLTPADRAAGVEIEFDMEGLLRGDTKSRFESYEIGTRIGVYLINECRRLENLPPVPGGDVARVQAQNIPITAVPQLGLPAPANDDGEPQDEEVSA
jgi:HK97 family phage portal protein